MSASRCSRRDGPVLNDESAHVSKVADVSSDERAAYFRHGRGDPHRPSADGTLPSLAATHQRAVHWRTFLAFASRDSPIAVSENAISARPIRVPRLPNVVRFALARSSSTSV